MSVQYYGALEAGGTKMVAAIYDREGNLRDRTVVKTETPDRTIPELIGFFEQKKLRAMGIGSFGPVEIHPDSEDYGRILRSPKTDWEGFSFYESFHKALECPVVIDTDVNAAVLGEARYGALSDVKNGLYLTVGTGVGAGIIVNGQLLHGLLHSEAGHILVSRIPGDDFECCCKYHSHCLEGLASGPAILARTGLEGAKLTRDHPVWDLVSTYLAEALADYALVLSPERMVLGGGVMKQEHLFPRIREKFLEKLGGYLTQPSPEQMAQYIVPSSVGGDQGILGAFCLARDADGE